MNPTGMSPINKSFEIPVSDTNPTVRNTSPLGGLKIGGKGSITSHHAYKTPVSSKLSEGAIEIIKESSDPISDTNTHSKLAGVGSQCKYVKGIILSGLKSLYDSLYH